MVIENNTRATKNLLGRFCFANMFYRGRTTLVIFPLLVIAISILFMKINSGLEAVAEIVIAIAIAFPIFIVSINVILFNKNMRNYPHEGRSARVDFTDEGIFVGGIDREKKIDYSFVVECVEFNKFFIMYFKKSSPIVIDKGGFKKEQIKPFREMMKRNIKK
ncbi:MAG: YcxB family protein [Bacillota bacterium]